MEINRNTSDKFSEKGYTFDDVLLVPAYTEVLPRDVDISTRLSRNLRINVPVVSAAMDTVTEKHLASAIARQGGIGMVHKNMSVEEQADQVRSVKRSESGMIIDPVTLPLNAVVGEAMAAMENFKIGGIPIVDKGNKLLGILTNRDLRFETNMQRPVRELMSSENLVTAPMGTDLDQARQILQEHKIEKLPVVDSSGKLVGLITYRDIIKVKDFPLACKDQFGRLMVGAAVGISQDSMERIDELVRVQVDIICIDTAHGHSKGVLDFVRDVKRKYPDLQVITGNIATGEAAKALVDAGADSVKVGVGPGSICTTRVVAGVGVPQLSAIHNAYRAIGDTDVPIIADGGIRFTGDIVKAMAAGADCIMGGSLFAGVEEAPGETIIFEGRKFKIYRGMGSLSAMKLGSKDRYFQDVEDDVKKLVPEGIEGRVPYKGTVAEVMVQYIGGLRAGMGYCGAANTRALKGAKFVSISQAGVIESHPHNVTITKEAPNYSSKRF